MKQSEAIEILKQELLKIPHLRQLAPDNQEFKLWRDKILNVIDAALDARDRDRFSVAVPIRIDWGWVSKKGLAQDRADYLEDLSNCETALKSIIQKYELLGEDVVPPRVEENKKAGLEQFHDGLVRYKQLVLMPEERRVAANLEAEFQELWLELQRKYGDLKAVIEKYGNSTRVLLQGGNYECEAFTSAFGGYSAFSPEALEVVMNTAIAAVNTTIGKLEKVLESEQLPREAVYSSDVPYNAYKGIRDIISLATRKLIVVDPYVDGTVVTLLENVQLGVEIQVLSRKMQGDFQLASQKFKEQREMAGQGSLEVRKDKGGGRFHDRFIVADDNFFHLGASIKDAGTKVFAINKMDDPRNKSVLMENIRKAWDAAEKVL